MVQYGIPKPGFIANQLWRYDPDVDLSVSACTQSNSISRLLDNECYFPILTHRWAEVNGSGEGSFDTSDLVDGLYAVTAVAKDYRHDNLGNVASRSKWIAVDNVGDGTGDVHPEIYVRDFPADIGRIPSIVGKEPFWISPDVHLRAYDVVPNTTAPLIADNHIHDTPIEVGTKYEIWIRVRNLGCQSVPQVKAAVWFTEPGMASSDWDRITGTDSDPFVVGDGQPSVTIQPTSGGWIGPILWTPSLTQSGHRCLMVATTTDTPGDGDPNNDDEFDSDLLDDDEFTWAYDGTVTSNNNLAQLNLTVLDGTSGFNIVNPYPESHEIGVNFGCEDFPMHRDDAFVELRAQRHPALEAAWVDVDGADVSIEFDAAWGRESLVVRYDKCRVELPEATLTAGTVIPARIVSDHVGRICGYTGLNFGQTIDGVRAGGVTVNVGDSCPPP